VLALLSLPTCLYSSMLPPGWTLGREVGVGTPSRNDWAHSNGSTQCPYPASFAPTSGSLGAFGPVLVASVGLFLSKLTTLELTTAAVVVIKPVVITLSLILDRYQLHGLHRWLYSHVAVVCVRA
jgi:hypothetical protein